MGNHVITDGENHATDTKLSNVDFSNLWWDEWHVYDDSFWQSGSIYSCLAVPTLVMLSCSLSSPVMLSMLF